MIYEFDPLTDQRWIDLLEQHVAASIFHSPAWLRALERTYSYSPAGITTCRPGGELTNGIVFCGVRSWITGNRLVSVPFADHCEPLADSSADISLLLDEFPNWFERRSWRYAELRPLMMDLDGHRAGYSRTQEFRFHALDLRPELSHIRRGFHKDCIERKIRRAQRESLRVESGDSDRLLGQFYRLMVITRQRHGLVPQPIEWFHSLRDAMAGSLRITAAFLDDVPIASILTLRYKTTATYKYGCSDARYHAKGAMPLLLWCEIENARAEGMASLDMGRSDLSGDGLIEFKDRLGARSRPLFYYRHPAQTPYDSHRRFDTLTKVARKLPKIALTSIGRVAYRHLG